MAAVMTPIWTIPRRWWAWWMSAGGWGENPAAGYKLRSLPFPRQRRREIVYGIGAIKGVGEGPIEASSKPVIKAATSANCLISAPVRHQKVKPAGAGKTDHVRGVYRLGPHRAALMNSLGDALKAQINTRKRKLSVRPICSVCWPRAGTN